MKDDRELVSMGGLSPEVMFTIRRGEPVYDTVRDRPDYSRNELIKIREVPGSSTCIFFNPVSSICSIYTTRPVQCRTLECWNPAPLIELLRTPGLERSDLIDDTDILTLIRAHEERLPVEQFLTAILEKEIEVATEMINYDIHFREFLLERGVLKKEELDFYLGRPLLRIGLSLGYDPDRYTGRG